MASTINTPPPPITGYNPVLVLLPPREYARRTDAFRRVHDKSGLRWTAHMTLMFVETQLLNEKMSALREALRNIQPFKLRLNKVDSFPMSGYDTVHLTTDHAEDQEDIQRLWNALATTTGYQGRSFTPHLTLGQAPNRNALEALQLLHVKAQHILANVKDLEWTVGSVVLLNRDEENRGIMKYQDEIFLGDNTTSSYLMPPLFPTISLRSGGWSWEDTVSSATNPPSTLSIATYNLLHDADFPFSERADRVIKEIVDADADILCLQEVSDEALSVIMESSHIRNIYAFSSRDSLVTLENERNLMILSRHSFSWLPLDTGSKHKPACIATFNFEGTSASNLVVACVHLTAGRGASPLEQKTRELAKIVEYLASNHKKDDSVIVGDLNWPNEVNTTPADGSFEDLGASRGQDPTYEPLRNALAAKTARESTTGQRYDRVYLKRNGSWAVQDFGTFAVGVEPASDHWGLKASLQRKRSSIGSTAVQDQPTAPTTSVHLPTTSIKAADLDTVLQTEGWLPSSAHERKMELALELLRNVLCPMPVAPVLDPEGLPAKKSPRVIIRLEAVGSYGLGVHCSTSDIDCLAIGNISPKTFWMLARSKIRAHLLRARADGVDQVIQLKRFVKDATVQMMELDVSGIKVDLQYCAAAGLAEHWEELARLQPDSPYFSLPHSSLVTLNAYRDLLTLRKVIPSLDQFRIAHRSLKLLLVRRGLWGARFGYLGGFHLTLLLTRIALSLPKAAKAPHLIEAFLRTYAEWDWHKDVVYPIPPEANSNMTYKRVLSKEPMVVLSIQRPLCNLTFHASVNSVQALSRGLRYAQAAVDSAQPWSNICGLQEEGEEGEKPIALGEFTTSHRSFIKMEVHYWGGNDMKGRALIGWLESRIVNLLVQLHQNVPELVVRFWPERLVDRTNIDPEARDPNGFYLFGLSASKASDSYHQQNDRPTRNASDLHSALTSCLRTFEHGLRTNERFYDDKDTFISLSHLKQSQIPSDILMDPFKWSDNGFDAPEEDEEEEDSEPSADRPAVDGEIINNNDSWDDFRASSSSQRKRAAAAAKAQSTSYIPAGKLRTSSDVYNRLMWDSTGNVPKDGYVIGYEDRFKGIKEMPLTSWKREVEDESFIPFHRVAYFKRLVDGVTLWDKRTKVDLVFGSGASGPKHP